jgi:hypothetical protein
MGKDNRWEEKSEGRSRNAEVRNVVAENAKTESTLVFYFCISDFLLLT